LYEFTSDVWPVNFNPVLLQNIANLFSVHVDGELAEPVAIFCA